MGSDIYTVFYNYRRVYNYMGKHKRIHFNWPMCVYIESSDFLPTLHSNANFLTLRTMVSFRYPMENAHER